MLYHQSHKTWGREVKEDAPTNTAVKSKQIRGFYVFLQLIEKLHQNLEPKCLLVNSVSLPDLVSYSYIFLKKLKGKKKEKC